MKVKFKEWNCLTKWGQYQNGEIALRLMEDYHGVEGEQVAVATVHLYAPPPPLVLWDPETQIWVKEWSENEGMFKALADAGVIEHDPVTTWPAGYTLAYLGTLTVEAQWEVNEAKRG